MKNGIYLGFEDLPTIPDAHVWANEFIKITQQNPAIALDLQAMEAWFANSIMAGYDLAQKEYQQQRDIAQSVDKLLKINNTIQAILLGIELVTKYQKDAPIDAQHGIIFIGNHERTHALMSEEERAFMNNWGWFQKYKAWAIRV